ncbi:MULTISPECIES: hypothetical protein [Leptospira]|uniref:Uncharacterized protein n=11 Tax=Leptospira interrogans TaxID=173 RepID=A0A0E2CYY2_LEPIR|nr:MULTISPECIES: hypothetical protein [Leptospira]EMF41395.1 hypothetical protein LEP1GSC067_0770 [Leptospira interrogans serovar Lora str. TE 1992]EMF73375.1 hypothetical protein LEP1GSC148_1380 [Leptospira interrogans serovar Canicola str. LT1962]EMG08069.1 hypothetical protein LEP1GSC151_0197 [Leptospira interrogans serovar Grippotyphosa str. LT2186]EMG21055.1 hypothetical protein LEP1GSC150_3344 [Leptospira interrogans serovar Copenhageni str. LT2050]EMN27963.1 hypothetical protein LEP1GSC
MIIIASIRSKKPIYFIKKSRLQGLSFASGIILERLDRLKIETNLLLQPHLKNT